MGKEQGKAVASSSVLGNDVSFLGRALCLQQPLAAGVRGQKYMREGCAHAEKGLCGRAPALSTSECAPSWESFIAHRFIERLHCARPRTGPRVGGTGWGGEIQPTIKGVITAVWAKCCDGIGMGRPGGT